LLFGEVLDGAFQTVRRNPAAMLGSSFLGQCVSLLLAGAVLAGGAGLMARIEQSDGSQMDDAELSGLLVPLLGLAAGGLGVSLLSAVVMSILGGVMAVPVSRSSLNRKTGFKQMWVLVRHRLLALAGLSLLMILVPLVPLVLLVIGAIAILAATGPAGVLIVLPLGLGVMAVIVWLSIKLLVAPAAITIEELGVLDSLRRSWSLTTASWWRIFGIVLVAALIIGVIGQVVQIPISLAIGGISSTVTPQAGIEQLGKQDLLLTVISMVVSGLAGALGFAFQSAVSGLVYLDLRMRRDGLDVELLRMMESGSDPDGVPGRGLSPRHAPGGWQPGTSMGFPTG
jgi:hypothetical protein